MLIRKLDIYNIISIEEAHIEFGTSGLVLLEGYNYDLDRSNGSGKSAVFNSLSFALYDKLPRNISKGDIKRWGQKRARVECEVQINDDIYKVIRHRPVAIEFYKNGQKIDITQEEFEKSINLTYKQFLITMYTAQGEYDKRFLSLNDRDKKDFVLELMNMDKFYLYHKKCKEDIKTLESSIGISNSRLVTLKDTIQSFKEMLEDEQSIDKNIESNNSKIKELQAINAKLSRVSRPDTKKIDEFKEKIENKKRELYTKKIEVNNLQKDIVSLENNKSTVDNVSLFSTCPNCSSSLYSINNTLVLDTDIKKMEQMCNEKNKNIDYEITEIKKKIKALKLDISKESELDKITASIDKKYRENTQEYADATLNISKNNGEIERLTQLNKSLKSQKEKNKKIKQKIVDLISEAREIKKTVEDSNNRLTIISSLSMIFNVTGAPAYIMDDFISSFNELVADNISAIWNNASYSIQAFKENKSGKVSAKFSESLVINGKSVSVGSLSGGERRSLSIAIDFTILDILFNNFGLRLSPIICDEPFDGLDSVGREMVIDLFSRLSENRQIWIVDHASEAKSSFIDIVRAEKKNGVTKIIT